MSALAATDLTLAGVFGLRSKLLALDATLGDVDSFLAIIIASIHTIYSVKINYNYNILICQDK